MPSLSKLNQLNLLHIINDGFLVSLPLLLPFIQTDLNLSLTQIGFLGTTLKSLDVLLALPSSHIAERFGSLRVLYFAIFIYSLGYLLTGFSINFWFLILAFLVAGLGFGIFHPIAFALVDTWSEIKTRGRNMGNFTAIGDIGRLAIASIITIFAAYLGWRYTAILYGLVALGVFVILKSFVKMNGREELEDDKQINSNHPWSFLRPIFLLVNLTGMLDALSSSALFVFIPFLLLDRGADASLLGILTAAFFVGNMLGKTSMGRLVDTFGNRKVFFIAEILMAILLIVITNLPSVILIAIISVFLGGLTKGTVPVIMTMISETLKPGDSREKAYGFNAFLAGIAGTLAPLFLGISSDVWGINSAFYLSAILAVGATIPVVTSKVFKLGE